ncbi:Fe-S cluster assembly ATPase SufC [Candidatus Pacearchaeota archaeon CG10_big_fil_rev_8_21_14_0_10_32_42]|nr:MAG: Fe-S cluster assembly ATPase SufC [Candidatus Pacearchaeota archaeon CG10_big_fil_rev_8_21_14_0_10_32_42]
MENKVWLILRPHYSHLGVLEKVGICGSGFFVKENLFVSAHHNLNESSFTPNERYSNKTIFLLNTDGKKIEVDKSNIYKMFPELDLVILKTNEKEKYFEWEKNFSKDDKVKNIGYPERFSKEILNTQNFKIKKQFENNGEILEVVKNYSIIANDVKIINKKMIILDYTSEIGFSGGPLIKNGKVIGMMSHLRPTDKKAVAISIEEIKKMIKKTSKKILEIKNLHVEIEGKKILKGVNLTLDLGEKNILMGPNGSGKSTLVNVIMGHPKYNVTKGQILLNGEDILELTPDKRAKLGIFLSFQYPREISGISVAKFLKTVSKELDSKFSLYTFKKNLKEKREALNIPEEITERYLNEGFSGGEKKKNEILQMLMFEPRLILLDETDSGLDIDSLKTISKGINEVMNKKRCLLIITHYKRILEYIKPDKVFIMVDGKIVLEGDEKLVDKLEEKGYEWIGEN